MQMLKRKNPNRLLKELMSIYVDKPQAAALRALSARTRVPQQIYLREGLDLVLKRYATGDKK
jgi:hypothetical protein